MSRVGFSIRNGDLHLQDAIDGPERQEPGQRVASTKEEVHTGRSHEAARQHEGRRGPRAQNAAHKL